MRQCHRCGTEWLSEKKIPAVKEICSQCSAFLHCCLNCRFYEPGVHNDCQIGTTEWVGDKEGLNFCDEFEFRDAEFVEGDAETQKHAREAFGQLFGDAPSSAEGNLESPRRLLGG